MKKVILIISLLMLAFGATASAQMQYETKEEALLEALNIVSDERSADEDVVTRSDFAAHIVRFMAIDSIVPMYDASFADVTEYSQECNSIYYLKSRNILSGAGDGNFYPDVPITKKQTAIVLARILGYGSVPGNIEEHASKAGVIAMNDEPLTYKDMIKALYNALESKCVTVSYGSASAEYEFKDNYLSETFGVYKERGIVKSNRYTSLDGNGAYSFQTVTIGNRELKNNGYDADDLLGMSVDYYYVSSRWHKSADNEDVLICAVPTSLNTVTEILARDITGFDGKTLKYLENGKTKNITIDSGIDVIYNGIACPDYELTMLAPQSGKITYIENGTGIDCIKVEEYKNGLVSSVSSEYIYLRNGAKIDLNKFIGNQLMMFDKDGNPVNDIPVNSILSMYYSDDKDVLKAVYSTDVLEEAKVTRVDDDFITVDGTDYYVNKLYLNWKSVLKDMGASTYKIYLDAYGEVARIEKASGGATFGYLTNVYKNDSGEGMRVNLLVEDGNIESFECDEKIRINGNITEHKDIKTVLTHTSTLTEETQFEQLVTYKLNGNGKISSITTAKNRDSFTGSKDDRDIDEFKVSYKTVSTEYYKTASKIFGVNCPVDDSTKVFFVPTKPQTQSDEFYWTGSISSLENDAKAECAVGYTTSTQLGNAEAMVVYGAITGGVIGNETRISVVKKIETTINEDSEPRVRVTFITGGKLIAYNLSPDIKPEEYNLSVGDIVRFAIDRNYEVSALETVCDYNSNDKTMALLYGEGKGYQNTSDAGGAVYRLVSGSVYDYDDGLLCLSRGDANGIDLTNPKFEYYRGIAGAFICVIDDNDVIAGSDADIIRYMDNVDGYSRMFITTRYGAVRDIVIYNTTIPEK